ncbi:MAG TPA: bifunctional heptose 7-phosphate kinase/heptose 1-phosphate adenyltransferase [Rhodospirillaceae bacterium]|nr:bifunctional heptose 7-phosphate kinase/heptose 1-phosphate adenyltransferase [Rhodospirillaceae bacterium]
MYAHLHSQLEKLKGHRVLCIGDVMLDRFVYGAVERISPEAPIPVIRVLRETTTMGGSGNVVRNLSTLGGCTDMVGVIGHDQAGYDLAELVASMNQVSSYLLTDNSRPTTIKTRYIGGSQQLLRADQESNLPISTQIEDQVLMRVRNALEGCQIVILSDYAKGVLTDRVVREVITLCREQNKPVLIDPKGRDFSRYKNAFMLTPNRKELTEATGLPVKTVEEAEAAARKLIIDHDLDGILAKLGGDGVCLVMRDKPAKHFHTTSKEVFDVSGAGDTVVATLALAIAGGISLEDSAALSNIAGSIVVSKIGTAAISLQEMEKELLHEQSRMDEDKIMSLAEVGDAAERWRKQGFKIGFTNGVFDLLHPGHLSSINQSRAACDKLIIGLNSDTSVKRQKGEDRPIQNENARAAVLAALANVDGIVIFGDDTPMELIKTIRPDTLVKGGNYTMDQVVGADEVKSWGGRVILADVVEGHSTSSTIARLKG